jgi:hypothetical protein
MSDRDRSPRVGMIQNKIEGSKVKLKNSFVNLSKLVQAIRGTLNDNYGANIVRF